MVKVKYDALTDRALDWAVAKCVWSDREVYIDIWPSCKRIEVPVSPGAEVKFVYNPTINWEQGGALIDRERLSFVTSGTGPKDPVTGLEPVVCIGSACKAAQGPTHLIAAMRCYVRSKLGDEIDIPEELA